MRKLLATLGVVFGIGSMLNAWVINHELDPQFRVWKSSALDSGTYIGTQIATSPIIFHCLVGSGTVNNSGNSAFTLFQSTGMIVPATNMSTKTIIPLDSANMNTALGAQLDILVTTHSYFNKTGGAIVQYMWDYLDNGTLFNRFPND